MKNEMISNIKLYWLHLSFWTFWSFLLRRQKISLASPKNKILKKYKMHFYKGGLRQRRNALSTRNMQLTIDQQSPCGVRISIMHRYRGDNIVGPDPVIC